METFATSLAFLASTAACAWCLVRAERAAWTLVPLVPLVGSWTALLAARTPTPGRALLAFTLVDLALLALSVLAVVRLLGGFEAEPDEGDDGGWRDDDPPRPPAGPCPGRPRGVRVVRPDARARSARGSARRGSSRSWSGRSGRATS